MNSTESNLSEADAVESKSAARFVSLLLGVVGAVGILAAQYKERRVGAEAALDAATTVFEAVWRDRQIASSGADGYAGVYPEGAEKSGLLWLGNSQLHAINQIKQGDNTAPYYASEQLGNEALALSLPNANLQEHLVVTAWALERRRPEWVILPAVFDDLREDSLRSELQALASPTLFDRLASTESGEPLVEQLREDQGGAVSENAPESDKSLQQLSESGLDEWLAGVWPAWRDRPQALTAVYLRLYRFRNRVFGIRSDTKRRMIATHLERNMQAFVDILRLCQDDGVRVLVYIAPLRWDVEPPYHLDEYEAWKQRVAGLADEHGAQLLNLERLVPDALWGTTAGEIDFMHFQGPGHQMLGAAIADALRDEESSPATGER